MRAGVEEARQCSVGEWVVLSDGGGGEVLLVDVVEKTGWPKTRATSAESARLRAAGLAWHSRLHGLHGPPPRTNFPSFKS